MSSVKPGDGRRIARVEKEVQESVARYLVSDLRGELPGLVTVSRVHMPGDLRTAKIYVSVIAPGADEDRIRDEVVDFLQDRAFEIQDFLNAELGLRFCPKLTFYPDESTVKVLKVEKILHDLAEEKKGRK